MSARARPGHPHPPVTIAMPAVAGMLSGVRQRHGGAWVQALLAQAGIPASVLEHPQGRVTGEQYVALFRLLMDTLDDECLGLMQRPMRRGSFALVARSTHGVPTAHAALRRIAQGFDLLADAVQARVVQEGDALGLAWTLRPGQPQPPNFLYEMLMRVGWRLLAWLHGGRLMPLRCDFCFARPDYAGIYAQVFASPLRFGQARATIWFERAALERPVRRTPAELEHFLQGSPANVVLPWLGERATSTRVHLLLRQAGPQWPDLHAAARALHMAASTLQRHLAQEGTSFQALKDQLRRDLAIMRLGTSGQPLSAIAAELGFSDSATFQRAFKAWTGSAPGLYRRQADRA